MEGVPWDFQRIRVAEQELIESEDLKSPVSMGVVASIINAGDKVPYTMEARNLFARNALKAVSQMGEKDNLDEILAKVVETTKESVNGKPE